MASPRLAPHLPTAGRRLAPGALILLGRGLLVLGLVVGVLWSVEATRAGLAWRTGQRLLAAGHYGAAVTALESAINTAPPGGGPDYDSTRARLALSEGYLAQHDTRRATAVLPPAAADPTLAVELALQRSLIAAVAGDQARAQAGLAALAAPLRTPGGSAGPALALRRAALWHLAELRWHTGAPEAAADFALLTRLPAAPHDPYTAAAWLRQAESTVARDPGAAAHALAAAQAALPIDAALAARPDLHLTGAGLDEGIPPAELAEAIPRLQADLQAAGPLQARGGGVVALYWGQALAELAAWPQAAALLEQARAADPTLADAAAYLGLAQERQGAAADAEASYHTAIRLDPTRDLARHLLARLLITQRRWAEARSLLDTVLAGDPASVVAHLDLAHWAQEQGMYDTAEAEYQAAEQQQIAQEATGRAGAEDRALNSSLLLAQFYFVAGTANHPCPPAVAPAQRAVARHPGAAEYDAAGWAQHLCGDDSAARAALERAVAADPRLPAAQYHLGMVLQALGDPGARPALTAAQDLDPGGLWARRAVAALVNP